PVLSGRGRTSQMMKAFDMKEPAASANAGKKTLDWLIARVAEKRFFGRWKLKPKSPEMLAALGAIASYWTQAPAAQEIIALAVKLNDPELKKAMGAQRVTGRFKAMAD